MASDHQMAVARAGRSLPPAPLSKTTRQVVPAFLQKLYEMVNDPKNSDLIRWSDAGDSFFVLDHERFAHDVLGRWFKHRNFNSFVRQLNMYGFHKIPHLQQGVLKSDNETEFWNFAHSNFHRGQPDLLCLIQRKKTANQSAADNISLDMRDPVQGSNAMPGIHSSGNQGQVIDVQAIVSGIAAIKRHQTTISSELNELRRSNQLLWQDAMAARTRHQKQQDTINRIVKFLAGVFGHHGTHGKDDSVQSPPSHVIPRRPARFMIEDARRDGKNIVEMNDMDLFSSVDAPSTMSEPSPAPSETTSEHTSSNSADPAPTPTLQHPEPQLPQTQNTQPNEGDVDSRAVTPTRPNHTPIYDFDHRLQGVLNQLSPSQIQQLVNSLATQPIPDPSNSVPLNSNTPSASTASHLTPYAPPPFDFSSLANSGNISFAPPLPLPLPSPSEGLIAFSPYDPLTSSDQAENHWQATEDIDKDVNALNTSIHQLIQTFGFDPNLVDIGALNGEDTSPNAMDTDGSLPLDLNESVPTHEFDFDNFFNIIPGGSDGNIMDYSDANSTAFLDEVPSPTASTASPVQGLRHLSPELSSNPSTGLPNAFAGKNLKRKSDVSELDLPLLQPMPVPVQDDLPPSPTTKLKKRKEN